MGSVIGDILDMVAAVVDLIYTYIDLDRKARKRKKEKGEETDGSEKFNH